MAKFWTLSEIKAKIEKDLDLQGEVFIEADEMVGYINQAIDEAEAEIHAIYEDYFLTSYYVPLVAFQKEYSLPENIYAHKIRKIIFSDSQSKTYEIARVAESAKFEDIALTEQFSSTEFYRYLITNDTPGDPKMYFVPAIREEDASPAVMRVWYLRNANRLEDDTDVCDIPEFVHFVIAYAKFLIVSFKEPEHPSLAVLDTIQNRQRELMVNTLSNMIVDNDNRVELDVSTYEEIS